MRLSLSLWQTRKWAEWRTELEDISERMSSQISGRVEAARTTRTNTLQHGDRYFVMRIRSSGLHTSSPEHADIRCQHIFAVFQVNGAWMELRWLWKSVLLPDVHILCSSLFGRRDNASCATLHNAFACTEMMAGHDFSLSPCSRVRDCQPETSLRNTFLVIWMGKRCAMIMYHRLHKLRNLLTDTYWFSLQTSFPVRESTFRLVFRDVFAFHLIFLCLRAIHYILSLASLSSPAAFRLLHLVLTWAPTRRRRGGRSFCAAPSRIACEKRADSLSERMCGSGIPLIHFLCPVRISSRFCPNFVMCSLNFHDF